MKKSKSKLFEQLNEFQINEKSTLKACCRNSVKIASDNQSSRKALTISAGQLIKASNTSMSGLFVSSNGNVREEISKLIQDDIQKFLDSIPIPTFIFTYPDLNIRACNKMLEEISGYMNSELLNRSNFETRLYDERTLDEIISALKEEKTIKNREVSFRTKSGVILNVLFSAERIRLGDKDYVISTSIDISDRKQAEADLKESEYFNDYLLNLAPNPILVLNPDDSIRYANPALEKLTGYHNREVVGSKPPFPWWPPDDLDKYYKSKPNIVNSKTCTLEVSFRKKNGELFWVVINTTKIFQNNKLKYTLSNWTDITERKRAEEKIKQDELRLQVILDSLTEMVSLIGRDGKVIISNKASTQFTNLDPSKSDSGLYFINPKYPTIYPNGDPLPPEETTVNKVFKRKRSIWNFEAGAIKEKGNITWLSFNTVPIFDKNGEVEAVVNTAIDITENKRLQNEKEQFTRKLLEVQEEERKRISRDLHDDTAQSLSLLALELDALINKEQNQLSAEGLVRLRKLQGMTERALKEVRRFSHELRPSVLEHFGLTSALEQIISEFNSSCQTEVILNIEGPERRLSDQCELTLFRIAQEALSNIRKHAQASQANVELQFTEHKIRLSISDNGEGFNIRKANLSGKGSLGLIGMRERARLIGAKLKIKSLKKKGTTIKVELNIP